MKGILSFPVFGFGLDMFRKLSKDCSITLSLSQKSTFEPKVLFSKKVIINHYNGIKVDVPADDNSHMSSDVSSFFTIENLSCVLALPIIKG